MTVSRETVAKLELYQKLLIKWQKQINLIGPGTLSDTWRRHFLDSTQLYDHVLRRSNPDTEDLIDLGSGAGFPGLVLAIMGHPAVTLIESNRKKCTFLRTVARQTETPVTVFEGRIEHYQPPKPVKIITARALASLDKLISLAIPVMDQGCVCLFLKGANHDQELTLTRKNWNMTVNVHKSTIDPDGVILEIEGITPKHDG